jgi:gamma-glutamylputrescine oxidase
VAEAYWLEEQGPPLRSPRLDGRVDVAIVGGGVTGCACARVLAEAGLRVRVHEARAIASGASGRNGGFALRGGAARYDVARESYGPEATQALWRWTEAAQDRIEALAGDAFRRTGSLRLAADPDEHDEIRGEFETLQVDGFQCEWHDELAPPLAGRFHGAVFHPRDGSVQPARFTRLLAAAAAEAGAELREYDRVASPSDLDAEHVVIATDGYGRGLDPLLDEAIWPARGQIVVTAPIEQEVFACPHYARQGFDYWQQLADGRILLGGFRDYSILDELTDEETITPVIQEALERFLADLLGYEPTIEHRWAGIFGLTQDLVPLVGRLPGRDRVWTAGGYSGHGNVMGFACGELVAHAILGRPEPMLELFRPDRFA